MENFLLVNWLQVSLVSVFNLLLVFASYTGSFQGNESNHFYFSNFLNFACNSKMLFTTLTEVYPMVYSIYPQIAIIDLTQSINDKN